MEATTGLRERVWRIDFENHSLDAVVLFGPLQLPPDYIDHIETGLVDDAIRDDAVHFDDRNFIGNTIIFLDDLIQSGACYPRIVTRALSVESIPDEARDVEQHADTQKEQQDDRENHPPTTAPRWPRR